MNKDPQATTKSIANEEARQEVMDEIHTAIHNERETQKSIDVHISNFQKKITEKRKNCMGMNSGAEN